MMEIGSTGYICGKMRGLPCYNFKNFFHWQVVLERSGYFVINPAQNDCEKSLNSTWHFTEDQYEDILAEDFKLIEGVDFVFVLEGWESSEGANREIEHAEKHNIPIFYEDQPMTGGTNAAQTEC